MNIAEYLKSVGESSPNGAWVMNDYAFMVWDKVREVWIVRENKGEALKHKVIFEGSNLSEAIDALKEISHDNQSGEK